MTASNIWPVTGKCSKARASERNAFGNDDDRDYRWQLYMQEDRTARVHPAIGNRSAFVLIR